MSTKGIISLAMAMTSWTPMVLGQGALRTDRELPKANVSALEIIHKALTQTVDPTRSDSQVAVLRAAAVDVAHLVEKNQLASEALSKGITEAEGAADPLQAEKCLRSALREAQAILAFKPIVEAPLPEGYPEPTPVGEIGIASYPRYRLARTSMKGTQIVAFWTLLSHIKSNDIAMTAPVEMTYAKIGDESIGATSMAFPYQNQRLGKLGSDDKIEVVDVPALTAVSIGLKGDMTKSTIDKANARLKNWLTQHEAEYEANGDLRVLGYNSPMIAAEKRFFEVQIPIRPKK